jgi:hypothetical protein
VRVGPRGGSMTWDRLRHRRVSIESFHGQDAALVKGLDGIAYYALLADLEELDRSPSAGLEGAAANGTLLRVPRSLPSPAKRFDRHVAPDGSEWIFDQPRNPDGSYASDDESTEVVESKLAWYPCQGPEVKAEHRPVISQESAPALLLHEAGGEGDVDLEGATGGS